MTLRRRRALVTGEPVENSRPTYALAALLLVLTASAAALAAHVAIDELGDVLLVRDAYDVMPHDSRIFILGCAVATACVVAWQLVAHACKEAFGCERALATALSTITGGSCTHFAAYTMVLTLGAVAAMGAADAFMSGYRIDDVADLFGGSLALGVGTALTCALLAALGAWSVLRRLAAAHDSIAGAIAALISLIVRAPAAIAAPKPADSADDHRRNASSVLADRSALRAPPHPIA